MTGPARIRALLVGLGTLLLAVPHTLLPGLPHAACVLWLMAAAVAGLRPGRGHLGVLALVGLAGLSLIWSVDPGQTAYTALLWAGAGAVVLCAGPGLRGPVAGAVMVVLLVCLALGLRQMWSGLDQASQMAAASPEGQRTFAALWAQRLRPLGPFASPDMLAGFLLPLIPVPLLWWRLHPAPWARALAGGAVVAGLGTLLLTQSAGGMVAAGLGTLAVFAARRRRADWRRLGFVAMVVAVPLLATVVLRGSDRHLSVGQSAAHRLEDWGNALAMAPREWPLGTGAGTFESAFNRYSPQGRRYAAYVHQGLVQVLVELGPVGAGLLACCYGLAVLMALRRARRGGVHMWLGAGVVASVVHHMVDYDLHTLAGLSLPLAVALLAAPTQTARVTSRPAAPAQLRLTLGMLSLAAAWLCVGAGLTERGVPRLPQDVPDLVADARGLALLPFDARAHLGVSEDLWLYANAQQQAHADAQMVEAVWQQVERQGMQAAVRAPWLPGGPMILARSRLARGLYPQALEAYALAVNRACCSHKLHQERLALARSLGRADLVAQDEAWLAAHGPP